MEEVVGVIGINTKFELPHFTVEEVPNNKFNTQEREPVKCLSFKMRRFAIMTLCVAAAALCVSAGTANINQPPTAHNWITYSSAHRLN